MKNLDTNQVPAEYTSSADCYTKLVLLVFRNLVHCIFRLAKECHKPVLTEGFSFLRHGRKFVTRCVISHKSEDLVYSAAEAWNHVYHRRYSTTDTKSDSILRTVRVYNHVWSNSLYGRSALSCFKLKLKHCVWRKESAPILRQKSEWNKFYFKLLGL